MIESMAEWMARNPKILAAMGVPIWFLLGYGFMQDGIARNACAILAACTMVAVTVMALATARWYDLIWPGIGFIAWSVIGGIRRTFR